MYLQLAKHFHPHFPKNVTLSQVSFKHFASKNQLTGLSVSGTLVENGLSF